MQTGNASGKCFLCSGMASNLLCSGMLYQTGGKGKKKYIYMFLRICSETFPQCDSGGTATGYRKASNWIWNGSLFLCGMFFK